MFELRPTTKYRRDVRRLQKRGYDLGRLDAVHTLLIETGTLPDQHRPHPLRGDYVNCIDAHIAPDWVIIYEVFEDENMIVLRRTGTHQDLFRG